jgi:hypothetical protein
MITITGSDGRIALPIASACTSSSSWSHRTVALTLPVPPKVQVVR